MLSGRSFVSDIFIADCTEFAIQAFFRQWFLTLVSSSNSMTTVLKNFCDPEQVHIETSKIQPTPDACQAEQVDLYSLKATHI